MEKQYEGRGTLEIKRLKQLEEENRRLNELVADLSLNKAHAAGRAGKKTLRPARPRELVRYLETTY